MAVNFCVPESRSEPTTTCQRASMDGLGEGKLLASSASEHKNPAEPGRKLGGAYMPIFLTDFVLFSSVVVLATGIVIAVAMLR